MPRIVVVSQSTRLDCLVDCTLGCIEIVDLQDIDGPFNFDYVALFGFVWIVFEIYNVSLVVLNFEERFFIELVLLQIDSDVSEVLDDLFQAHGLIKSEAAVFVKSLQPVICLAAFAHEA